MKPYIQKVMIDTSTGYIAEFLTDRGIIQFDLLPRECPKLVNNFIYLATGGFYDGTRFHRVVEEFVIQGGDPAGTGEGDPGYFIPDECSTQLHRFGTLSLANSGPDTNGCQFFITLVDAPWLDGMYCPIGTVVQGSDLLFKIGKGDLLKHIRVRETGMATSSVLTWSYITEKYKQIMLQKDQEMERLQREAQRKKE